MKAHNPMPPREDAFGATIDCACGSRGVLYTTLSGAQHAFVKHVAKDAASALGRKLDTGYNIKLAS